MESLITELTFNVLKRNDENAYQKYNVIQYVFYVFTYDKQEKIEFIENLLHKHNQILIDECQKQVWGIFDISTNNSIRNEIKSYL